MSNCSLGYSFVENTDTIKGKLKTKTKTEPKKSPSPSPKLQLEYNDDSELADVDFSPPPKPVSSGVEKTRELEDKQPEHQSEAFTKMTESEAVQYYGQYNIPFATPQLPSAEPRCNTSDLEKKLNYMIHLLEDQKDERVGGITEEIVLYCFLGVFIIFVLDSFAKVGKYVR
jgi:hypothetical protein